MIRDTPIIGYFMRKQLQFAVKDKVKMVAKDRFDRVAFSKGNTIHPQPFGSLQQLFAA